MVQQCGFFLETHTISLGLVRNSTCELQDSWCWKPSNIIALYSCLSQLLWTLWTFTASLLLTVWVFFSFALRSPDLVVVLLLPGGRMQSFSFPSSVTTYDLTGLQPNTEYIINLFTLYEGREEATPVSTTPRGQWLSQGAQCKRFKAHKKSLVVS